MQPKRLSQQYYRLGYLILVMMLGMVSDPAEAQQLNEIRSSPPVCGDFLARWKQKPAAVEFVRCNIIHHEQVDRLAAIYHVKGYDAIEIEKFLQKQFGIIPSPGFIVDAYPIEMKFSDFIVVAITVFIVGLIASIGPSLKAASIPAIVREE